MKKRIAILAILILLIGAGALAEATHPLARLWNEHIEPDLWGDGWKPEMYDDVYEGSGYMPIQPRAYATDDGVNLGRLGWKYGDENTNAARWLESLLEKDYYGYSQDSVLAYLATQEIDTDGTRFLDSRLQAWDTTYDEIAHQELYHMQVSIHSGRGLYEIIILLDYENAISYNISTVLIHHSGSGAANLEEAMDDIIANDPYYPYMDLTQHPEVYPYAPDHDPLYVVNCDEWISVWSDASNTSERIGILPRGSALLFWDYCNEDYVYYDFIGDAAYVSWDYLSFTPPD